MQTELFEVNTPESLGVTPRYVLQHHAISRSAHNFSATAKKLTAMAMALLPADLSSLSSAFTFADFCSALGYTKSGRSFTLFKVAVKECMENVIEVEGPPDQKGKTNWVLFHWFRKAEFNKDSGICTMIFDQDLASFLKEMKRIYAKINLSDIGKLQSRHAMRIYEMAISYRSLQGKDGNDNRVWYWDRTVAEIRKLLGIGSGEYQESSELRRRVIDGPVKEINEAGIGVKIKATGKKKGRSLDGFRFDCEDMPRTTSKKRERKAIPLSDLPPADPGSRAEKEAGHLKELYPDEFACLYQQELGKLKPIGAGESWESLRRAAAEHSALKILREKHSIKK